MPKNPAGVWPALSSSVPSGRSLLVKELKTSNTIRNPRVLDHIEWRDLERLLAEAMSGIGFDVTLTPGSKDGGKDLILDCTKKGTKESFIVEVKH